MKKLLTFFILIIVNNLFAQIPTLSGTVQVSINEGTIDCDLTLYDIPELKEYEILINSGFNLNVIRTDENEFNYPYSKKYDKEISEESFLYSISNEKGKLLPNKLRFIYSGKFPVKKDTTFLQGSKDWNGNIAFNGKSLRMAGATNWYPVLYDIEMDKRYNEIKYNINIVCEDCKTLYINGNPPLYSTNSNFKSDYPTDLLLFIGNYDFKEYNKIYYLNPDLTNDEIKNFSELVQKFKTYYSKNVKIPYEADYNFIQTTPTFKKNGGFLFVSYPTITNVGSGKYGLKSLVTYDYTKPLVAHELAHYYFGAGYRQFNSEIGNVIQESFSEYISAQAVKEILGQKIYDNKIDNITSRFKKESDKVYKPISNIGNYSDFGNYYAYAYNYFPTILLAIEKEVGQTKMFEWVNNLLITKANFTDFLFLKSTLEKTIGKKKADILTTKYLTSEKALKNALEKINE